MREGESKGEWMMMKEVCTLALAHGQSMPVVDTWGSDTAAVKLLEGEV